MNVIAEQPYYKMIRQVSSIKQQDVKDERIITLFKDRVTTRHRKFPLEDVHDMSFRNFGEEGGLLYLHTIRGVFSYHVDSSPEEFIKKFKRHIEMDS